MSLKNRAIALASISAAAVAIGGQPASAHYSELQTIEPGALNVFICGWVYAPVGRSGALSIAGEPLDVRKVINTRAMQRTLFEHRVEVRDTDDRRFRMIINRGRQALDYVDTCNAETP
jgi:hypothetical protein